VVAAVAVVVAAAVLLTANIWLEAVGRGLVCEGEIDRERLKRGLSR
jgi:hypothetical protein